ncbi:ATP-dependent Clp protease ATP-binding subunit ClpX, partial [Diplocarpon rosae]
MPALTRTFALTIRPRHLPPVVLILTTSRHPFSTSNLLSRDSQYYRPDFQGQGAGFTSSYEPGRPTEGPLSKASNHGPPRLTPLLLKEHLDNYVVGQDKAKKVTSVAIFNHYQRIRELRRLEDEEHAKAEQQSRWEQRERELTSHPVETLSHLTLPISTTTTIEKSNLLLLGPSGVGKTYILSTLARVLEVPFATVDCSSLTQAGYIGTDIESAIERLLLASSHSISACESGIIFFDEVDKLAKPAVMTHGRDVSGEGVQQGLLKMIEGTTVTVNAKSDRSSKSENAGRGAGRDAMQQQAKSEQYTIDTTNILFVFAGAFVGLEKIISSRLSSGSSLGFGAQLKSSPPSDLTSNPRSRKVTERNLLNAVTPSDLQHYGLIPELLGRIPILASLTPLSLSELTTILTSPRNSLVKQFTMFRGPGSAIRFVLVDEGFVRSQFSPSSSSPPHSSGISSPPSSGDEEPPLPRCFSRSQSLAFEEASEQEEEAWKNRAGARTASEPAAAAQRGQGEGEGEAEREGGFEKFRRAGGSGM